MTIPLTSLCATCRHRDAFTEQTACDAFPGGIPDAILSGAVSHMQPVEEDHGITYRRQPVSAGGFLDAVLIGTEEGR